MKSLSTLTLTFIVFPFFSYAQTNHVVQLSAEDVDLKCTTGSGETDTINTSSTGEVHFAWPEYIKKDNRVIQAHRYLQLIDAKYTQETRSLTLKAGNSNIQKEAGAPSIEIRVAEDLEAIKKNEELAEPSLGGIPATRPRLDFPAVLLINGRLASSPEVKFRCHFFIFR